MPDTREYVLKKNGWSEWEKYILKTLDDLKHSYHEQEAQIECNKTEYINAINKLEISFIEKIGEVKSDINVIKTKITQRAGLVGAIAGFLPSLAMLMWSLLK